MFDSGPILFLFLKTLKIDKVNSLTYEVKEEQMV